MRPDSNENVQGRPAAPADERILIYGAGAIGSVLGAYLSRAGLDVTLCTRNAAHVEAMNAKGLTVTGKAQLTVPVRAALPQALTGHYTLIFLVTKVVDNPATAALLQPLLHPAHGLLCTLQNGLPEPVLAQALRAHRVLGGTVAWGATLTAPGECTLTSEPEAMTFGMGGLPEVPAEDVSRVRDVLAAMCPVEMERDLPGARWTKLLINATFSGLSTVFGGSFGDVVLPHEARNLALRVMRECFTVGLAGGVRFAPVQGKDPVRLFYWRGPLKRWLAFQLLPVAMKKHLAITPSLLKDIRLGRPTEIDAINGAVCAEGRRLGVPTPFNDRIVQLVHAAEAGTTPPGPHNLAAFSDLLNSPSH